MNVKSKIQCLFGGKHTSLFEGIILQKMYYFLAIAWCIKVCKITKTIITCKYFFWSNYIFKNSLFAIEASLLDQIKMTEFWLEHDRNFFTPTNLDIWTCQGTVWSWGRTYDLRSFGRAQDRIRLSTRETGHRRMLSLIWTLTTTNINRHFAFFYLPG